MIKKFFLYFYRWAIGIIWRIKAIFNHIRLNIIFYYKCFFILLGLIASIKIILINKTIHNIFQKKPKIMASNAIKNQNTMIYDRQGELLSSMKKNYYLVLNIISYKQLPITLREKIFNMIKKWDINFKKNIALKRNILDFKTFDEKLHGTNGKFLDFALGKDKNIIGKLEKKINKFSNLNGENIVGNEKNISKKKITGKIFTITSKRKRHLCYSNSISHIMGIQGKLIDNVQSINSFLNNTDKNIDNLTLTIDMRVQQGVSDVMCEMINHYRSPGGWCIVLDLKTREIISLFSYPDFDPNDENVFFFFENSNKFLTAKYEIGSTAKIISSTFFMSNDSGLNLTPETIIHLPKNYKIGKFEITDTSRMGNNPPFLNIFVLSSNIGFAHIMESAPVEKLIDFLEKIGFYEKIKINDVFYEKAAIKKLLPKYQKQSFSYGYGIKISPLRMTYILANCFTGEKKDLSIIKSIRLQNNKEKKNYNKNNDKIKKDKNIIVSTGVRRNLINLLHELGKRNKQLYSYNILSKTGTTKLLEKGYYSKNKINAFLVAFHFKDNPNNLENYTHMIILCIENPSNVHRTLSNLVTRPTMIKIIERIEEYLN